MPLTLKCSLGEISNRQFSNKVFLANLRSLNLENTTLKKLLLKFEISDVSYRIQNLKAIVLHIYP